MMDHPEPISKRPMDIPQCRKGFSLEEARTFIDQVMEVFRSLEDMSDLRSMYETGKQLSRAYFDCHSYRPELAQHLTNCEYPAFASKMMKKLNNMGVFKNDDIWFSSFYFYNTTWNFSETWPEFATALASAGLPNLLNLNIGHQPYLENLSSKNVYYLIKASLSIIHNIARVPGNTHFFTSESVRQALLHLTQREEDFLRCVATLCLAHIITEPDTNLVTDTSAGGIDVPRTLFGFINLARTSEKRRYHGFQVIELLGALSAFSVHDTVKSYLVKATVPLGDGSSPPDHSSTCISLLKDFIDPALSPSPSSVTLREAEECVRILWNLTIDPTLLPNTVQNQIKSWVAEILANSAAQSQFTKAMLCALDSTHCKLSHSLSPTFRDQPVDPGSILFSFAPSNRIVVHRIGDRLRDMGLPIVKIPFGPESVALPEASVVGLSMCACNVPSRTQWLECLNQASIMVVCLSDAYRLSPGCRLEVEYFMSRSSSVQPKYVLIIILQPKLKPTSWLSRASTRPPIDFNGKRDLEASYEVLVNQLKELISDSKKRAEAAAAAQRHSSLDGKRHMAIAGDTGVAAMTNSDVAINHINGSTGGGSRATSGLSIKRDDALPLIAPHNFDYKAMNLGLSPSALSGVNARLIPTNAWRHVIRPEVRNWSANTIATWLRFRGLGHISANMAGGIDGVLLSQLAGLRVWAPEYFTQALRTDLGLAFTESLRFLEALDELAPDEEDKKAEGNSDLNVEPHSHMNAIDGGMPRS